MVEIERKLLSLKRLIAATALPVDTAGGVLKSLRMVLPVKRSVLA